MARPTTKDDLLDVATSKFDALCQLIDSMPNEMQTASFSFDAETAGKEAHWKRDKNIRDVLIHLYEWHQLLLLWVQSNQDGIEIPFLPPPYNWKTYGQMNVEFWEKHQTTSLESAVASLTQSHGQVVDLVAQFSSEALFTRGYFPWTGTNTLGAYCVSATASHYDWAMKKLKKHVKSHQ